MPRRTASQISPAGYEQVPVVEFRAARTFRTHCCLRNIRLRRKYLRAVPEGVQGRRQIELEIARQQAEGLDGDVEPFFAAPPYTSPAVRLSFRIVVRVLLSARAACSPSGVGSLNRTSRSHRPRQISPPIRKPLAPGAQGVAREPPDMRSGGCHPRLTRSRVHASFVAFMLLK